jgi:hypothetical protein
MKSTNYQQGIIPSCTVTVYLSGTQILATIYKDGLGTPLTNPFTASTTGKWLFFPSLSSNVYDIVMSGGTPPNVFPAPVPLTAVSPGGGGGGGGTGLQSFNGRTAPNAVLIPGDFTTILSGSPFGFSGSGGLAYDSGTGIVSPSSQWRLSGGNLTGLGTFNLNNGTTNTVVLNPNGTASFAGQLAFGGGGAITTSDIICLSTGIHCPAAPNPQYQTIQINGVSVTPAQPKLNFLSGFAGVNNGGNSSTDISLSNVPNSALANNSITINTSGSVSGGGNVALGGNLTLTGSGTTSVTGATANGFAVTTTNPTTTPVVSVNVDSTHFLPINNGSASLFLNQAGTYTTPPGSVTSVTGSTANGFVLNFSNPTTTPVGSVNVDSAHILPVTGGNASLFLNQAGTYTTPPGSVSTVSGVNANGFVVTVSNPSTTPSISVNTDSGHILPVTGGNAGLFLNQAGTYTATPASSPAGSACDVQFNNGGVFGADTGHFCYNSTSHTLTTDSYVSQVGGTGSLAAMNSTSVSGANGGASTWSVLNGTGDFQTIGYFTSQQIYGGTGVPQTTVDHLGMRGYLNNSNPPTWTITNSSGNFATSGSYSANNGGPSVTVSPTQIIANNGSPSTTYALTNSTGNATFVGGLDTITSSGFQTQNGSFFAGVVGSQSASVNSLSVSGNNGGPSTWQIQNANGSAIFSSIQLKQNIVNGAGLQVATGNTCVVAAGIGNSCNVTLNLPVAEPDTNYIVVGCSVIGDSVVTVPTGWGISPTTTSFGINYVNLSSSGATTTNGIIRCLVLHL